MKGHLNHPILARITFLLVTTAIMFTILAIHVTSDESADVKALSIEATIESTNKIELNEVEIVTDATTTATETPTVVDESVPVDNISEQSISEATLENETLQVMAIDAQDDTLVTEKTPYDYIINDIELLKSGDNESIIRYFGESNVFTPQSISDRTSASNIQFIESRVLAEGDTEVKLHICTINYGLMNNDFNELSESAKIEYDTAVSNGETPEYDYTESAKKAVASNLIEGKYDTCYNIPVIVRGDKVEVTESIKQAITGGWYPGVGVSLTPTNCIAE